MSRCWDATEEIDGLKEEIRTFRARVDRHDGWRYGYELMDRHSISFLEGLYLRLQAAVASGFLEPPKKLEGDE